MKVPLRKHLQVLIRMVDQQSRERDEWAEKRELERFANLSQTMTANAEAQAKAVKLALEGTAAMADRLAEATATSTERIVTRLESLERAFLTGSSERAGVEGWWTKARVNSAAVIGALSFIALLATLFITRGG